MLVAQTAIEQTCGRGVAKCEASLDQELFSLAFGCARIKTELGLIVAPHHQMRLIVRNNSRYRGAQTLKDVADIKGAADRAQQIVTRIDYVRLRPCYVRRHDQRHFILLFCFSITLPSERTRRRARSRRAAGPGRMFSA